MQIRNFAVVLAIVSLGATTACSRNSQASAGGVAATPKAATTLEVVNQAYLDMNVYVLRDGGQRIRLGTATGNQTSVFTIPSDVLFGPTPLRFVADPIGGRHASVSTSILVNAGDSVEMRIPPG